jgi:hypothetical protein
MSPITSACGASHLRPSAEDDGQVPQSCGTIVALHARPCLFVLGATTTRRGKASRVCCSAPFPLRSPPMSCERASKMGCDGQPQIHPSNVGPEARLERAVLDQRLTARPTVPHATFTSRKPVDVSTMTRRPGRWAIHRLDDDLLFLSSTTDPSRVMTAVSVPRRVRLDLRLTTACTTFSRSALHMLLVVAVALVARRGPVTLRHRHRGDATFELGWTAARPTTLNM